jgi:hypothetical protein
MDSADSSNQIIIFLKMKNWFKDGMKYYMEMHPILGYALLPGLNGKNDYLL